MSEPILYHGDEIEVCGDEATWTAKKVLRIAKHHGSLEWQGLWFLLELRVDNPNVQSFAGIFIDEAAEPSTEIPVSSTEYELFERAISIEGMGIGTHLIQMKLKTDGAIYNRLFEVYTIPPLPAGSVVKTS